MSLIRITRNPTDRQLFVFGASWLVFLSALAAAGWMRGRPSHAEALEVAAVALPLAGLASRTLMRLAFVGLSYATYPIGVAVSHLMLAVFYYLALTPIGLTMRLLGRDPLDRKFDPGAKSYWKARKADKPVESYFKQDS
jgi:hypothetical protein